MMEKFRQRLRLVIEPFRFTGGIPVDIAILWHDDYHFSGESVMAAAGLTALLFKSWHTVHKNVLKYFREPDAW